MPVAVPMDVGRIKALDARSRDPRHPDVPAAAHTDDFADDLSSAERAFIRFVLHDITLSPSFGHLDRAAQDDLMMFRSWPRDPEGKVTIPTPIPGKITSTMFCMPQVGNLLTFFICKQADDMVKGERRTGKAGFGHT